MRNICRIIAQFPTYLLLEGLANKHLLDHFNDHSTESSLLKVHHDIPTALSVNKAYLLVLLDLSAAFDTIDIHRLICVLDKKFGVVGKAKAWFASYLLLRSQCINIGSCTSNEFPLKFGVPQFSVPYCSMYTLHLLKPSSHAMRSTTTNMQMTSSCTSSTIPSLMVILREQNIISLMHQCHLSLDEQKPAQTE